MGLIYVSSMEYEYSLQPGQLDQWIKICLSYCLEFCRGISPGLISARYIAWLVNEGATTIIGIAWSIGRAILTLIPRDSAISDYHEALAEAPNVWRIRSSSIEHSCSVNSGLTNHLKTSLLPACIHSGNTAGGPSTHPQPGAQNIAASLQACLTESILH